MGPRAWDGTPNGRPASRGLKDHHRRRTIHLGYGAFNNVAAEETPAPCETRVTRRRPGASGATVGISASCRTPSKVPKVASCYPWAPSLILQRKLLKSWCCKRGLNSRPLPYQGSALPLSYCSIRAPEAARTSAGLLAQPAAHGKPMTAPFVGGGSDGAFGVPGVSRISVRARVRAAMSDSEPTVIRRKSEIRGAAKCRTRTARSRSAAASACARMARVAGEDEVGAGRQDLEPKPGQPAVRSSRLRITADRARWK